MLRTAVLTSSLLLAGLAFAQNAPAGNASATEGTQSSSTADASTPMSSGNGSPHVFEGCLSKQGDAFVLSVGGSQPRQYKVVGSDLSQLANLNGHTVAITGTEAQSASPAGSMSNNTTDMGTGAGNDTINFISAQDTSSKCSDGKSSRLEPAMNQPPTTEMAALQEGQQTTPAQQPPAASSTVENSNSTPVNSSTNAHTVGSGDSATPEAAAKSTASPDQQQSQGSQTNSNSTDGATPTAAPQPTTDPSTQAPATTTQPSSDPSKPSGDATTPRSFEQSEHRDSGVGFPRDSAASLPTLAVLGFGSLVIGIAGRRNK